MLSELSRHKILYPDIGSPIVAIGLYGSTVSCCWVSCSLSLSAPAWYYRLAFGHPTPAYNSLTYLPYYFGCRCKSDTVFTTGVVGIRFSSSSSSGLFEAPDHMDLLRGHHRGSLSIIGRYKNLGKNSITLFGSTKAFE